MGTTKDKFDLAFASKESLRQAINEKGQTVTAETPFSDYAASVRAIKQASAEKPVIMVSPAGLITATAGEQVTTQQLTTQAGQTIIPGTLDKTIPSGRFTTGNQIIKGDPNLIAENIKTGVTIFGVAGGAEDYVEEIYEDALVLTKSSEGGTPPADVYTVSLSLKREPRVLLAYETYAVVVVQDPNPPYTHTVDGGSIYFPNSPINLAQEPPTYYPDLVHCWYMSFIRDSSGNLLPGRSSSNLMISGKTLTFLNRVTTPVVAPALFPAAIQASFSRVLYIPK